MNTEEIIIRMIEEITGFDSLCENKNIDLIESNVLDSLNLILLMNALEDRFFIDVQPTQVDPKTWHSVEKIAQYVEKEINQQ